MEPKVRSRILGRNPDHGAEQFDQLPIAEECINNFKVILGLTQARLPWINFCSEKSLDLEKPRRPGKFVAMRWRANFFKDLVNSEGRASSSLQRSIEISRAKNIDHAVEVAKRRYERICHVPIWSLYADRLELESKGQRILYRPTHDEIALTRIPGRDKGVGRNARRGLHY